MKTFVIRDEQILANAKAFMDANWKAMSQTKHPLAVEFKPESKKRSSHANRYYWNLMHQIADNAWVEGKQYAAEMWHEAAKRRFIGYREIPGGGMVSLSTTELSTAEFANYVQKVEAWAATELGITFIEGVA